MEKVDYKKELKRLYKPSARKVDMVEVPQLQYLMIDGEGDPNTSQAFQDAIDVLYPLSYALKFMVKRGEVGIDYGVLPLEGLWWVDDMSSFSVENMENHYQAANVMKRFKNRISSGRQFCCAPLPYGYPRCYVS
jgi:hypothetical protein